MNKYLSIFLLSILLIACSEIKKQSQLKMVDRTLKSAMKVYGLETSRANYFAYVIIPGTGCAGCITHAEMLLHENIELSDRVCFVLTNIESLKMLRNKLGNDVLDRVNVVLDKDDHFFEGELISTFPKVLILDGDGSVSQIFDVSLEQDGIGLLKNMLLSEHILKRKI